MSRCVIAGNFAGDSSTLVDQPGGSGGGIYNAGRLLVEDSILAANRTGAGARGGDQRLFGNPGWSGGHGGGICSKGTLIIVRSSVSKNIAGGGGPGGDAGGIHAYTFQQAIVSCTVFGNRTGNGGWGGTAEAPYPGPRGHGGGVMAFDLSVGALVNNIIAGNSGAAPDVFHFRSRGNNLIGITNDSEYVISSGYSDLTGSSGFPLNPRLAPLTNKRGLIVTMALMSNSPAIDVGTLVSVVGRADHLFSKPLTPHL